MVVTNRFHCIIFKTIQSKTKSNAYSMGIHEFQGNSLRPDDVHMRQWASHHWVMRCIVACSVPIHYLNQRWRIFNWTLSNTIHWNHGLWCEFRVSCKNENFWNAILKISAILFKSIMMRDILTNLVGLLAIVVPTTSMDATARRTNPDIFSQV